MSKTEVVLDIETIGRVPADEALFDILVQRVMKKRTGVDEDEARAEATKHLALDTGLADIVAIGVLPLSSGSPFIMLLTPAPLKANILSKSTDRLELFQQPAAMLTRLWRVLQNTGRIITFNGRSFDGPQLMVKSTMCGVTPSRNFVGYRYDIAQHCDLYDCLTGFGATGGYSLDYWCRVFDIPSPKENGGGEKVGELYAAEKYGEIVDYLTGDLAATADLYLRMKPMLSTFQGGPTLDSPVHTAA